MTRCFLAAALALLALALPARAEWPERPISLIVGFAPGGGTDIAARTVARFLEARLGQPGHSPGAGGVPVVVVNRPGAAGELGYTATARAAPDGYTFGMTNTPNLVTLPIERRTGYQFSDLAMVANLVDDPGGLWVRADSPFRSLRDVVEFARANPEGLSWGITGRGSYLDFSRRDLERLAGVRITAVAYPGSSAIFQGLLNGSLMVGAPSMTEGAAMARQGQIRALGQMAASRWSGAPDVPTFREQGYDIIGGSMRGIAAPAGTPPGIIHRMAEMLREIVEDPEFRRQAEQQSLPLRYMGPQEITAELTAMRETYQRIWQERPWID